MISQVADALPPARQLWLIALIERLDREVNGLCDFMADKEVILGDLRKQVAALETQLVSVQQPCEIGDRS